MLVEDLEMYDWKSNNDETGKSLRQKSITSYCLSNSTIWYESIKDLTFEAKFYDEIPNILPYDKCMVRWQNKSPKDSPNWGPVSTKEDVEKLFYTSLRCKDISGDNGDISGDSEDKKIYCFRPWIETYEEFRCFWNGTLKVVSSNGNNNFSNDMIKLLYSYLAYIANRIPYHRCVFDICRINENNKLSFKIIEFNSWETNSCGYHIDWKLNTDMLYGDTSFVYFVDSNRIVNLHSFFYLSYIPRFSNTKSISKICPDNIISGDYLYHNGFLYIHNDIWLGKFTLDLKAVSWKRGIYRFGNLKLINNQILIDGTKYDSDLREISKYNQKDEKLIYPRYGIRIKYEDKVVNISLTSECEFCFTLI